MTQTSKHFSGRLLVRLCVSCCHMVVACPMTSRPPPVDGGAPLDQRRRTGRAATPGPRPHHPKRAAKRARVLLLAAEGAPNRQIATLVGMNQLTVAHWRRRFKQEHLAGLTDRQRPGRPPVYGHDQRLRILATVTQQPPDPASHWSHPQLAKALWTSASRPSRPEHEHLGHGTATVLAALDVHGGGIAQATDLDPNTAANFIAFLDDLDATGPADLQVRLVLDNGSSPSPATPAGGW
jgi:transposase